MLMNLELMKTGFPPAVLPVEKRLDYYNALDKAHTESIYVQFLELIAGIVESSFAYYWHAFGIKD